MRTIVKTVAGWTFAALMAVAGASAATDIAMEGDYGKVSWTSWEGKKGYSGYLFVTHQPDDTTYLYYVVQSGNEPAVAGYGLIPNDSLRRGKDGSLELLFDTSRIRAFTTSGPDAAGMVNVTWRPDNGIVRAFYGASGAQVGRVSEVTQGAWTSGVAVATGSVVGWKLDDEQSAEIGSAVEASNQIGGGN